MFQGSLVALVTPMKKDGSIDQKSLQNLVEWHIQSKTEGLIIAGTTGEGCTLTAAEQFDLLKNVVKQVANRVPVIAGTGSNSTEHTVELTKAAKNAAVDACLIVTPYYNKPSQTGLYEHYKTVAEAVAIPILLYNVPSRTACDLLPETISRLAAISNIIGIKEATGKLDRAQEIFNHCGKNFKIYSGDDATACDLMLQGAHGVISVTANIAPQKMREMCDAALSGNKTLSQKINAELMPLHRKLFLEANPIPVKWAAHQMGLIPEGIRLPLTTLNEKFHTELKNAMRDAGVLNERGN